jgi:multidrug transporter EmrE-like cation transporter
MTLRLMLLILVSVSLSALAQIALKAGMSSPGVQQALTGNRLPLVAIAASPQVVGGLLLYACGAVLWLLVLARLDVSFAYPFVGLGFILTMILGGLLLDEPLGAARIAGTLLVATGTILVART